VRRVIWRLFELCPTPQAAVAADVSAIRAIIQPLGLFNKRAVAVQRFSQDYTDKEVRACVCVRVLCMRVCVCPCVYWFGAEVVA
jgi:hypothetical protein